MSNSASRTNEQWGPFARDMVAVVDRVTAEKCNVPRPTGPSTSLDTRLSSLGYFFSIYRSSPLMTIRTRQLLSILRKHLHRPANRTHQLRETRTKSILSGRSADTIDVPETELPNSVAAGGDDLPCSLSSDNKTCTPCASRPSAASVSWARRAVDHTNVPMMAR